MSSQAGVLYFDRRPVSHEVAEELLDSIGYSNCDARGDFSGPGLFMAHAAIWIDDVSTAERQPSVSAAGTTISFDGRLDNREDLLQRLRPPHRHPQTDSVLALAAYEAWGVDGLVHLIGDWSMALWEPATSTVILASDYAGVRPLYYHANPERVVWSSCLRALVKLARATELDDQFVAGFLTGSGSPNRTPYRGILPVPGGQALRFGGGVAKAIGFWNLPVRGQIRYHDYGQYEEQLRSLFRESVRARLRTTYPVCSELSGGLDSSSIACMATDLITRRGADAPRFVSVSFGPAGAPDEKFYTAVREFCRIDGIYIDTNDFPFLNPEFLDGASPAVWEPLFREVARHVKDLDARVYLTGQGGDLLMGNWIDDSEQIAARLRRGQFKQALIESVGWSKATRVPAPALLWRALMATMPSDWSIGSRYRTQASVAIPERYGDSLTAQFKSATGVADPDWIWSKRWKNAPPERRKHFRSVSRVLESGLFRPLEQLQHLYYTFPYAHRPLVEFLLAIPAGVLCKPGEPRSLMRRAFRELLPPEIARRRSKASYTGEFLKSVRPAVRQLLAEPRPLLVEELGYVDARDVRARLKRITQSLDCNEPQLRQIVLLEFWLRRQKGWNCVIAEEVPAFAAAANF